MNKNRQSGFSLVELMVTLAVALIVVGAVVSFAASLLNSNRQNIEATRLMQELRTVMDYTSVELKRAGYDQNAIRSVRNATSYASPFRGISIEDTDAGAEVTNCIIYAYDRAGGTPGTVDAGEIRGIRRVIVSGVGVIEIHRGDGGSAPDCDGAAGTYSTFPATCNGTSNWCPLSDVRSVNISAFNLTRTNTSSGGSPAIRSREFLVSLQAALVTDTATARTMETRIRVRADCIASTTANLSACDDTPTL